MNHSVPFFSKPLRLLDPTLFQYLLGEEERQKGQVELIASENFVSSGVREAQGGLLTNKYAEGYPSGRYYEGCQYVDAVETLAIERACRLFGCAYANVQPHSGSQANQAVFLSLLKPGDRILSMDLKAGGHLTHGSPVNLTGKYFDIISYGVDQTTQKICMEAVEQLARTHRPRLIIAGASAYSRTIDFKAFRQIADQVGAYLLVDMAHIAGLVATGHHPSPFPHAHVVSTTTHKTLRGPRGGMLLWNDTALTARLNSAVFPGLQGGPLMHVIAAKALCFQEAADPSFKDYIGQVLENAAFLSSFLAQEGFGIVSGGTDNHLFLLDLGREISGKDAAMALYRQGITCNKNAVPGDLRSPRETSGLRMGTAAMTTRHMKTEEMKQIGDWILQVLRDPSKDHGLADSIKEFCHAYPFP